MHAIILESHSGYNTQLFLQIANKKQQINVKPLSEKFDLICNRNQFLCLICLISLRVD